MRQRTYYDGTAKKQTVSLTLNSDLYAKAKAEGLRVSQIAEAALAEAFAAHMRAKIQAEIEQDLRAYNEIVDKYGSPAELARQHYAELEDREEETSATEADAEDAV